MQRKQAISALAKLTALANDDDHNTPLLPILLPGRAAKSIAPIEFLFAAYLCFRFPLADHALLSQMIQGMMMRVRGEHSDLMINNKNERTIRTYIREMEAINSTSMAPASRKRPRGDGEDNDEEWMPAPADRISAARARNDYMDG